MQHTGRNHNTGSFSEVTNTRDRAHLYRESGRLQLHSAYDLVPPVLGLRDFSCHMSYSNNATNQGRTLHVASDGQVRT